MGSPEELREVLAAGVRPGTGFLPTLHLDDEPRLPEERDIIPQDLKRAREADFAMRIMSLANGESAWGPWRYLILGSSEDGEVHGVKPGSLSNDIVQRIVHRYCEPAPLCYYQESRYEGKRVGMVVITNSALKPHRFACDVVYEQAGHRELAYRQGEVWIQRDDKPMGVDEEAILRIKLDAALAKPPAGHRDALAPLAESERWADWAAFGSGDEESLPPCERAVPEGVRLVVPAEVSKLVRIVEEKHILSLCGPPGSGKRTLARHLAGGLASGLEDAVMRYASPDVEPTELLAAVSRSARGIVLACNVTPENLRAALPEICDAAERSDSFMLITSHLPGAVWSLPPTLQQCVIDFQPGYPYTPDELDEILRSYITADLERYQALGYFPEAELITSQDGMAGQSLYRIAEQLGTPGSVARFAALALDSYLGDEREIAEAIHRAADLYRQILDWYWALDYHERYFALAVCLFGKLPISEFWRLYEGMVKAWREHEPLLRTIPGVNAQLARFIGDDLGFGSAELGGATGGSDANCSGGRLVHHHEGRKCRVCRNHSVPARRLGQK